MDGADDHPVRVRGGAANGGSAPPLKADIILGEYSVELPERSLSSSWLKP